MHKIFSRLKKTKVKINRTNEQTIKDIKYYLKFTSSFNFTPTSLSSQTEHLSDKKKCLLGLEKIEDHSLTQ